MWQSAIAYTLVGGAGAWVAWSVLLPRGLRARLSRPFRRSAAAGGACGDCGCGKG
jgi:hypothetical protein